MSFKLFTHSGNVLKPNNLGVGVGNAVLSGLDLGVAVSEKPHISSTEGSKPSPAAVAGPNDHC